MEKRAQGRPSFAAGAVGAQKIVESIRAALRANETLDMSRKALALRAGVTPALISYYFPDKATLFEQIAVPVIEGHRLKLNAIVNSDAPKEENLRSIIAVLADLYGKDARILNMYNEFEVKYPDDYADVSAITSLLSDFFWNLHGGNRASSLEAAALQGAVRGMCELAKRIATDVEDRSPIPVPLQSQIGFWVDRIARLFAQSSGIFAMEPPSAAQAA